jgi:hypothetical protein
MFVAWALWTPLSKKQSLYCGYGDPIPKQISPLMYILVDKPLHH